MRKLTDRERYYLEKGHGTVTRNRGAIPVKSLGRMGLADVRRTWNAELGISEWHHATTAAGIRQVKENARPEAMAQWTLRGP